MKKYRNERIEKEICRIIGGLLLDEVKGPNISGIITPMRAKVAPDLRDATIYVSILSVGGIDTQKILEGLNEAKGYIRKRLGEKMLLRIVPDLHFKLDDSIEHGIKISTLLKEIETKP